MGRIPAAPWGCAARRTALLAVAVSLAAALAVAPARAAPESIPASEPLRERAPVPPPLEHPAARIVAERWIELILPERPPMRILADDPARYLLSSPDDPDYAPGVDPAMRRPVRIMRRHFPERAPFTPPEPAAAQGQSASDGQPGYLIVVHRVFLEVPADRPFKPGKTYTVSLDRDLSSVAALTAAYRGDDGGEVIHVNQEAWAPEGPKVAYASLWLGVDASGARGWLDFRADLPHWNGTFSLVPETGGAALFTAAVKPGNVAEERYSGSRVARLDFSGFSVPGRYRILLPGVGFSRAFSIGAEGFGHVVYTVMRGMAHLRDGAHGLDSPRVTRWNRPPAHLDDAVEESTGLRIDLSGGHMDAGDREKMPLNMALAASHYLVGARLFPGRVEALGETLQLPESGNGIPDYLDELFYELDALARMVTETHAEGALTAWIKPAKSNFEKGVPPGGVTGRIWYDARQGRLKSATLAAAGALAMAAADPLVARYGSTPHPDRSAVYLRAALMAWGAWERHESDEAWWKDDSAYNGGVWRLGRHPWSSELIFAAANLHAATGERRFLERLEREWPSSPTELLLYGSDPAGLVLQDYLSVALSARAEMPERLKRQAREWIFSIVDSMNRLPQGEPAFGVVFQPAVERTVGWFFSGLRTGYPNMVAWGLSRDDPGRAAAYRDRLAACWNYLLGANPRSISHITGLGDPESRVRWIVNEIWDYQWRLPAGKGWIEPPPGLVSADIQHGDYGRWFDSPYNAARVKEVYPALDSVPLFYRWTDGWNVTSEASSHVAAVMAAIALPWAR